MFDRTAELISAKVCINAGISDKERKEIIQYGISTVFSLTFTLLVIGGLTAYLGIFIDTMTVIVGSLVLRFLSGGHHSKTFGGCLLVSVIVFTCLGYFASILKLQPDYYTQYLIFISAIVCFPLVWIYAPVGVKEKPIVSERQRIILRRLSIGYLVAVYVFVPILGSGLPGLFMGLIWQSIQLTSAGKKMLGLVDNFTEIKIWRR